MLCQIFFYYILLFTLTCIYPVQCRDVSGGLFLTEWLMRNCLFALLDGISHIIDCPGPSLLYQM